jgi:addiction module RelE/StbE family toxin
VKVRYTKRALRDLAAIDVYITQHSPKGAARIGARIRKRIDDLRESPEQGALSEKQGVRILVVARTPYVVLYRVRQEVEVLTILHGFRRR